MESGIYIVATPIGNLGDITQRALDVLSGVDSIAAEDTRHSRRLLDHFGIDSKLVSLHEHNEQSKAAGLIDKVKAGESLAVISDAGTPLISDPGHVLVSLAVEEGVSVLPIPGPSALTAALSVSGIACAKFIFEGFLPVKSAAKRSALEPYQEEAKAVVFYESPHRIVETLALMAEMFSGREMTVARELTKKFETIKKAEVSDLHRWVLADENQQKGEFVLVLSGSTERVNEDVAGQRRLLARLMSEMPPKKAVSVVVDVLGGNKKDLYRWAIELKNEE